MVNEIDFTPIAVDLDRLDSLFALKAACELEGVQFDKVTVYQHGFVVKFKGLPGDAALHMNTYGNYNCDWETYEMPWDYDDVSVHTSQELAKLLGALKRKEDWQKYNERN